VLMGIEARQESARAVAARDFMLNIFARANQEKSRGADITARDLLETGRKDVLTRLAGQPRLQAELLRGIAKIQGDMGEFASADSTYSELVRLRVALREPKQEAWARADHAYNALQMGNPALATSVLEQAKDVRNRPIDDPELDARFSELDAWIAINEGDAAGARELLRNARRRSAEALGADHLRTFRLGNALLRAEGQLRNVDAALALHEELRQVAPNVAGIDANELATMDWQHVSLLQDAGRFDQALTQAEAALPMCISSLGADEQYCRLLLILRGRILLRLGLVERAARDMPRFAALADDDKWPYVRVEAMLLQFRLASRMGANPDLRAMVDRVRAFGQSGPENPMNPVFKATALLALAESSLLHGGMANAQEWVGQAIAKLPPGGASSVSAKFAALAGELNGVALLYQGETDSAMNVLMRAQQSFESTFGVEHPMTQLMSLNTALALEKLNRREEALAIVIHAEPILRAALGLTAPVYERVQILRRRLESPPLGAAIRPSSSPSAGLPEFFS
jgi:eukaryotic-like serine/threonine-protein kinase